MKFKSINFLLCTLFLLTSCSILKNQNGGQEIGAWGPIAYKTNKPSGVYYLTQEKSPNIKLEVKSTQFRDQLFLYPSIPLQIGEIYQLMTDSNSEPALDDIKVREPCLVYLEDPSGNTEIWKNCPNQGPSQLTKTDGKVKDLTVSRSGDLVFFTTTNDLNGTNIWQIKPDGSGTDKLYDCSETTCSDLDFSPLIGSLGFIQTSEMPYIKILDINSGTITDIQGSGSDLRFSPDGQYLSFLDNLTNQLTIINLSNMKSISLQSGAGLVGDWAPDSQSILYGEFDYWGGIPGVKVFEFNIKSGELKQLLYDPNQELEFYQPTYTREAGVYLVTIRQRSAGASKQIWLLGEGAEGIKQITNDPLYHYSSLSWNPDYSELVFQRYPINTSDGKPQVVIWNQSSDTFQVIAENAANPFWLP